MSGAPSFVELDVGDFDAESGDLLLRNTGTVEPSRNRVALATLVGHQVVTETRPVTTLDPYFPQVADVIFCQFRRCVPLRQVLRGHVQGLSTVQIARELAVAPGTVRSLLRFGRQRLAEVLETQKGERSNEHEDS